MGCTYPGCGIQNLEGKDFCVFHAPLAEKTMSLEEFNSSLLTNQRGGLCDFSGIIFLGDITFDKDFVDRASFQDAKFPDSVSFANLSFTNGADFRGAIFAKGVNLKRAVFKGNADFTGIKVNMPDNPRERATINCRAVQFRGSAAFAGIEVNGGRAVFAQAQFHGKADFNGAKFTACEFVDFSHSRLMAGVDFTNCQADAKNINFAEIDFAGGDADFSYTGFQGGDVRFSGCRFSGGQAKFFDTCFAGGVVDFTGCQFTGGDTTFEKTRFMGGNGIFRRCTFANDVYFRENDIAYGLEFDDMRLAQTSAFYFTGPEFVRAGHDPIVVMFRRIRFNAFLTFFEDAALGDDYRDTPEVERPIIAFRYAVLKDVYFSNNDFGLFSFYNSVFFEEAIFARNRWYRKRERVVGFLPFPRYYRGFQVKEELLLDKPSSHSETDRNSVIGVNLPGGYFSIALLYNRLKTAADRIKNYQAASYYYFNELEMRRRGYGQWMHDSTNLPSRMIACRNYVVYEAYRIFAGFGEKPVWSFIWFWIFTCLFSTLHMFNGINALGRRINYDLNSFPPLTELISDFGYAVIYSLYRVIPSTYLPYQADAFSPASYDFWTLLLSFLNTVVLILMIIFTGMGLKRHFRRF